MRYAKPNAARCTRRFCVITIPENWALLREALLKMGRRDLIGMAPHRHHRASIKRTSATQQAARGVGGWSARQAQAASDRVTKGRQAGFAGRSLGRFKHI